MRAKKGVKEQRQSIKKERVAIPSRIIRRDDSPN
jgi:hypothetical protein